MPVRSSTLRSMSFGKLRGIYSRSFANGRIADAELHALTQGKSAASGSANLRDSSMDGQMQPASPEAGAKSRGLIPPGGSGELSVSEAARSLAMARYKRDAGDQERQAAQAERQRQQAESALAEADAAPQAGFPVRRRQTTRQIICRPSNRRGLGRLKQKDRWQSLPRETQEYLAGREQEPGRLCAEVKTEPLSSARLSGTKAKRSGERYDRTTKQAAGACSGH